MNARTIKEKFSDFTTDHTSNRRWVCVKGKVPVRPGTDQPLEWRKAENRYFWDQVQKIPSEGCGVVLNKTGLACVDFDKCLTPEGLIADDRIDTMVRKLDSWTEISSSGAGLHVWVITDANTASQKPGTGYELITDGHVKVTGHSYRPTAALPIRMVDGDDLRKILGTTGARAPGPRGTRAEEKIPEGSRNNGLFRLAARLRHDGMSEAGIRGALLEENRARCVPPLTDDEVIRIAGSAGSYPPGKTGTPAGNTGLTELAASERFVMRVAGGCVFNVSTGKWHVWNGKVWRPDERNIVKNRCRNFVKSLYADLGSIDGKGDRASYLSDIEKLNTRRGIENILVLAGIQLTRRSEDFNSNPHLLNLQNGTIEFTDAGIIFREHRKEDMCSFIGGCEYLPETPVPEIWLTHADKIASGDPDLARTLQNVSGYCLEGGNPLEKIVIVYGAGRNGKSVSLRTFARILGGYAVTINPLTLMEHGNKTTSPERLKMRNARLIVAQEPNKQSDDQHLKDTSVLDSGFLKAASGKDLISARGLYSNTIEEFAVTGVVVLSTNPLPTVNDRSVAFWDRLVLLPFDHYFRPEERDPDIEARFNAVLPGILNWFIQGWEDYRKTGTIGLCETAKLVLNDYRNDGDEYATFVGDCVEDCKGAETTADDLYAEYDNWAKCHSQYPKTIQVFGKEMASRFSKKRKKTGVVYRDVRIRTGQQQLPEKGGS